MSYDNKLKVERKGIKYKTEHMWCTMATIALCQQPPKIPCSGNADLYPVDKEDGTQEIE